MIWNGKANYVWWLLDIWVWTYHDILWKEIFVQESWIFKLVAVKWYIDTALIPWKEYEYLDWFFDGKMYYFEKAIWEDKILEIQEK